MRMTGTTRSTVIRRKRARTSPSVRLSRRFSSLVSNTVYFLRPLPRTMMSAARLMANVTRNSMIPRVNSAL